MKDIFYVRKDGTIGSVVAGATPFRDARATWQFIALVGAMGGEVSTALIRQWARPDLSRLQDLASENGIDVEATETLWRQQGVIE